MRLRKPTALAIALLGLSGSAGIVWAQYDGAPRYDGAPPPPANYDPRSGQPGEAAPPSGWYWNGQRWVRLQTDPRVAPQAAPAPTRRYGGGSVPYPSYDDPNSNPYAGPRRNVRSDNDGRYRESAPRYGAQDGAPAYAAPQNSAPRYDGQGGSATYGSAPSQSYEGGSGVTAAVRPPVALGAQPEGQPGAQPGANGGRGNTVMTLPAEDQPEVGQPKKLPERFRRRLVDYDTKEPTGTLIVDTANTYLYLVLGKGKAMRYGIGVGREGFTWAGTERISRMKEWPDWHPPQEMIERQPYLPRFMAGGPGNPLGARALYLGKTLYRIHGTNQPSTIGSFVSSGCIRLLNEDIEDLYQRINVGTRVVVLPGNPPAKTVARAPEHDAVNAPPGSASSATVRR